ncbi:MAG: low molecular weight phosphotyrosine protein phosphatase [Erysipelotrichaceae bacterium]|nr:low molecular weight phosphotyrosine protein phosphatase [Erysipelotrichaceae bacterium]
MAEKRGLGGRFYVASAATSTEEIGNPIYPPARRKLLQEGIDPGKHLARRMRKSDYDEFDFLIGMDEYNILNMMRMYDNDPDGKIHLMMSFAGKRREISDPWYTGDFDATYSDLRESLEGLIDYLMQNS